MEKEKRNLQKIAGSACNSTRNLLGKAKESIVKITDKNDDGELNMEDLVIVADALGTAAKNTSNAIKVGIEIKNREMEKKALQPIFLEDLNDAEFFLSKLIRICEMDKKHAESEVCQGAIGFTSLQRNLKVVNLFENKVDEFGLTFYPNKDSEVYYVDPSDRDRYIALDVYFSYLKNVRVNELQKVAQDLGAKHFKVTYKEQKTFFSKRVEKVNANTKMLNTTGNGDIARECDSTEVATVEIAAESEFPGHAPMEVCLKYLQHEPSIQTLVAMRQDKNAPLTHQKFTLKLSNSSGIKENDAIKIDAALKSMKIYGNTTVTSEVQNEARRFFEYEIDF